MTVRADRLSIEVLRYPDETFHVTATIGYPDPDPLADRHYRHEETRHDLDELRQFLRGGRSQCFHRLAAVTPKRLDGR